ncbi:MAG: NFACT family protein [Candidatus Zixiibacteriota bacterium]|nr:MAG: NFACT family protein [candidate division Zixibacteria bacterium]
MPMQTALHILSLVSELKSEILGGKIVATEFYRKERAFYLIVKKKQKMALGFVYHPVRWGTYLVPASKLKIDTREKPRSAFDIQGCEITVIEQLGLDRIFTLTLKKDKQTLKLVIEAIGPNGNVWLLDHNGCKLATLRRKQFQTGEKYSAPPLEGKLNPFDLPISRFADSFNNYSGVSLAYYLEKQVLGINYALAREIAHRAGASGAKAGELDQAALTAVQKTLRQVCDSFENPSAGYLYRIGGKFEAYPLKFSWCEKPPEKFKTLSLAVMAAAEQRESVAEQQDEIKTVTGAVSKAVRRLEKRLRKIEEDIKQAANYEEYRRMGELLQINFKSIKKGMSSIVVDDVYSDSQKKIEISLDPSLSPNENAESYFKRYRKGREGLHLLKRRLQISRGELDELLKIEKELQQNFEAALERYGPEITSLIPKQAALGEVALRLPYRPHTLSTGLTIFIGRDGADNDRTTFEFARPYELWFHAQQCAGSHVVMKFPNKSFEPSRREIEETAAIAAYCSKAKNDTLVPVIYTQRKYVRKPRKAKAGLVTVEREKSVMVAPAKPA